MQNQTESSWAPERLQVRPSGKADGPQHLQLAAHRISPSHSNRKAVRGHQEEPEGCGWEPASSERGSGALLSEVTPRGAGDPPGRPDTSIPGCCAPFPSPVLTRGRTWFIFALSRHGAAGSVFGGCRMLRAGICFTPAEEVSSEEQPWNLLQGFLLCCSLGGSKLQPRFSCMLKQGEIVCSQLLFAEVRFATGQGLFPGCSQPSQGTQGVQGSESRSPVTMYWGSSTHKRPRMSFSPQIHALASFTHCHQPSLPPGGGHCSLSMDRDAVLFPSRSCLMADGTHTQGPFQRGGRRLVASGNVGNKGPH